MFSNILPDANMHGLDWHPGGIKLTTHALELCAFKHGARLLDVGCGLGQSVSLLREHGFVAYGLDRQIFNMQEKFHGYSHSHICATAMQTPFKDASFDGIVCECVLSLMPCIDLALKEFWRISTGSATLLLSDIYSKNQQGTAGSLNQEALEKYFSDHKWKIRYFEDHTHTLKNYLAQLAWHDVCLPKLATRDYAYGLWIATKDQA